jgi:hypothetical protein
VVQINYIPENEAFLFFSGLGPAHSQRIPEGAAGQRLRLHILLLPVCLFVSAAPKTVRDQATVAVMVMPTVALNLHSSHDDKACRLIQAASSLDKPNALCTAEALGFFKQFLPPPPPSSSLQAEIFMYIFTEAVRYTVSDQP